MEQNGTREKDTSLALALASGQSVSDVAAQANVGRTTIYRKLEQPEFHRMVCEFRDKLIATALGRLADNMTRAANALAALLDAPEPHIRIRAARSLFSMGIRLRDSIDLSARMRSLEAEIAQAGSDAMKQEMSRALRSIGKLPDQTPASTPGMAETADGGQLAREVIRSFTDELETYRRLKDRDPKLIDPNTSPEWQRDSLLNMPPEDFTFHDFERLSRLDPALAESRWQEVKAKARQDVDSGWLAGRALEPAGGNAWERACYLAIRDKLHRAWSPLHAGEAMLLDEAAQYEMIRMGWLRLLSQLSREPQTEIALRKLNPSKEKPRPMDAADAVKDAMKMVERLHKLSLDIIRTLVSMRQGKSAFIVQRTGQINLTNGPQANALVMARESEEPLTTDHTEDTDEDKSNDESEDII